MSKLRLISILLIVGLATAGAGIARGAGIAATILSTSTSATSQDGSAQDPEELLRRGGCMLCHRWSRQWIGPSFAEISQRYRSIGPQSRQALIMRLRSGSVGNHSPIPIGPCDVSRISDEELRLIVEHILGSGARPEVRAP